MRFWPRSPGLALLALALSVGLWYGRALERRMRVAEREVEASLTLLNVPPDLIITSDVPRTVVVRLRGPLEPLQAVERLAAVVNLEHAREGEAFYPVDRQLGNLPATVDVVGLAPLEVPLRLEKLAVRPVPVRPTLVGTPAEGFSLLRAAVNPPRVTVRGPSQLVQVLPSLSTDPVVMEGARASFTVTVGVRSPSPFMRVVEPLAVEVLVEIGPGPSRPRDKEE